MKNIDEIIDLFQQRGDVAYHGEAVSQTEHALQAAALAERHRAPATLVVAALLHDIGHLLDGQDEDLAVNGIDGQHEAAGHAWLSKYFGPDVTEPIRLHVAAKRYLCGKNEAYLQGLSPASQLSLELQGGPMTPLKRAGLRPIPTITMPSASATGTIPLRYRSSKSLAWITTATTSKLPPRLPKILRCKAINHAFATGENGRSESETGTRLVFLSI